MSSELPHIVLAADDQEADIDLLRLAFKRAGMAFPLQCYYSGEALTEALATLAQTVDARMPLACFLDIKMPGMTGLEVLQSLRADPAFDSLPVIMLTSSIHSADIDHARTLGAQCYLVKFPKPEVLREVLAAAQTYQDDPAPGRIFPLGCNLLVG